MEHSNIPGIPEAPKAPVLSPRDTAAFMWPHLDIKTQKMLDSSREARIAKKPDCIYKYKFCYYCCKGHNGVFSDGRCEARVCKYHQKVIGFCDYCLDGDHLAKDCENPRE